MAADSEKQEEEIVKEMSNVSISSTDDIRNGVNSGIRSHPLLGNTADLPCVLIIANVDDSVFEDDDEARNEFETLFKAFDPTATFSYLKSFRRARIACESAVIAANIKIHLHEQLVFGKKVKCYFAQPLERTDQNSSPTLQPPAPTKQWLISPPASPPVGWEPIVEQEPLINYDLLQAITSLGPGQAHTLHSQTENQPGIVVHVCEEDGQKAAGGKKIQQTRCPER